METISLFDGLILTIVSMLLVFLVLSAIGLLTNFVAKFVQDDSHIVAEERAAVQPAKPQKSTQADQSNSNLAINKKNQLVAELMALTLAAQDESNRKFEIVESKRIK